MAAPQKIFSINSSLLLTIASMHRSLVLAVLISASFAAFGQSKSLPINDPLPQSRAQGVAGPVQAILSKRSYVVYCAEAEKANLQGEAVISIIFDESGHAERYNVESGDAKLAECAAGQTRYWEIQPFSVAGAKAKVKAPISFVFLNEEPHAEDASAHSDSAPIARYFVVGQQLQQKLVKKKYPPMRPPFVAEARISGTVLMLTTIDEAGKVTTVRPYSGHPMLIDAAIPNLKRWEFKPLVHQGRPVPFETVIEMTFGPYS